jgi:hypothetical protein
LSPTRSTCRAHGSSSASWAQRGLSLYATESPLAAPLATRVRWSLREAVVIWVNAGRLAVYGLAGAMGIDRDTRIGWFN